MLRSGPKRFISVPKIVLQLIAVSVGTLLCSSQSDQSGSNPCATKGINLPENIDIWYFVREFNCRKSRQSSSSKSEPADCSHSPAILPEKAFWPFSADSGYLEPLYDVPKISRLSSGSENTKSEAPKNLYFTKAYLDDLASKVNEYSADFRPSGVKEIKDAEMLWNMVYYVDAQRLDEASLTNFTKTFLIDGILMNRYGQSVIDHYFSNADRETVNMAGKAIPVRYARANHIKRMIRELCHQNKWVSSIHGETLFIHSTDQIGFTYGAMVTTNGLIFDDKEWNSEVPSAHDINFHNVEVHEISFLVDKSQSQPAFTELNLYLLFALIGMLPNGKHVVPADVYFVKPFSVEKIYGLANQSGNVTGITFLDANNVKALIDTLEDGGLLDIKKQPSTETLLEKTQQMHITPQIEAFKNKIDLLQIRLDCDATTASLKLIRKLANTRLRIKFNLCNRSSDSCCSDALREASGYIKEIDELIIGDETNKKHDIENLKMLERYRIRNLAINGMDSETKQAFVTGVVPRISGLESLRIMHHVCDFKMAETIRDLKIKTVFLTINPAWPFEKVYKENGIPLYRGGSNRMGKGEDKDECVPGMPSDKYILEYKSDVYDSYLNRSKWAQQLRFFETIFQSPEIGTFVITISKSSNLFLRLALGDLKNLVEKVKGTRNRSIIIEDKSTGKHHTHLF